MLKGVAGNGSVRSHPRQSESRLQVSVRLLSGQNLGNPVLQGRPHFLMGFDNLPIPLRIDHERNAHGLHCLMNPGVGEYIALVGSMPFPT